MKTRVRTILCCEKGWQRDKEVFEQMKQVLSEVGRLADERPAGLQEGYLAERPPTLSHCYRVWSPCGCCWTYMSASASVLTQCDNPKHDFDWKEAEAALGALMAAEKSDAALEGESLAKPEQLALVKFTPS